MKKNGITERQVLDVLEAYGHSLSDYFLFGEGDSTLVCTFVKGSGMLALLIEDDDLAKACVVYLKTKGAEQFATPEEVNKRFR